METKLYHGASKCEGTHAKKPKITVMVHDWQIFKAIPRSTEKIVLFNEILNKQFIGK